MAGSLLCSCAVTVYDSQAYRKMDVTRKCISRMTEETVTRKFLVCSLLHEDSFVRSETMVSVISR